MSILDYLSNEIKSSMQKKYQFVSLIYFYSIANKKKLYIDEKLLLSSIYSFISKNIYMLIKKIILKSYIPLFFPCLRLYTMNTPLTITKAIDNTCDAAIVVLPMRSWSVRSPSIQLRPNP